MLRYVFGAHVYVDANSEREARQIINANNPMTHFLDVKLPNIIIIGLRKGVRPGYAGYEGEQED